MEPTQIDFLVAHIESLEAENAKLKADRDKLVELVYIGWNSGEAIFGSWPDSETKRRLDEIIGGGADAAV